MTRGGTLLAAIVGVVLITIGVVHALEVRLLPEPETAPAREDASADWRLVFAEEFDGGTLDRSSWTTCYWWDDGGCTNEGNRELQWYLPGNVSVDDGVLRLEARRESVVGSDGKHYRYTSGMVTTGRDRHDLSLPPRFAFRYGRLVARMRMPAGTGLWPALWMLPVTHESRPEIDVMEVLGHAPDVLRAHIHYWDGDERRDPGRTWHGPDTSEGWHRYEVRWSPTEVVWLVDGHVRWRFDEEEHVPAEHMYILVNLAVGGDWPGAPSPETRFPATLEVDYIRVWKAEA